MADRSASRAGAVGGTRPDARDGEPADAAARRAGPTVERARVFARDLPRDLRRVVLAAVPGQVLGPFPVTRRHRLVRIVTKCLPTLDMPVVRDVLVAEGRREAFDDPLPRDVYWSAWTPVP